MSQNYEAMQVTELKSIAKERGIKHATIMKKNELIEALMNDDLQKEKEKEAREKEAKEKEEKEIRDRDAARKRLPPPSPAATPLTAEDIAKLDSGIAASGILEVMPDGFGFIRCDNYMPGDADVYVSPMQIRRLNLKTGDIIEGNLRIRSQNEKFAALLYVKSVNGYHPEVALKRTAFEDLTPIFPDSRLRLERPGAPTAMRVVDLVSPIGKGQRGMIVAPPKVGKTTLLKDIAKSITINYPDMHLIILLIDERPEEVTDIKESIEGKNV